MVGSTRSLLTDLRIFNNTHWGIRYPVLEDQPQTSDFPRPTSRRSLSIADDSSLRADVVISPARGGLVRSITLPDVLEKEEDIPADETPEPSSYASDTLDFNVFRLYVRRRPRVRLEPILSGSGQERGLRSGTLPASLAVGIGEADHVRLSLPFDVYTH